jgi:protein-tyrosine phosphatase
MKILMVCLGNICRSPVAEGILRNKANKHGLNVEVDSAGTSALHAGENPDPRSVFHSKSKGIDISKLVSRQFKVKDFDLFDLIYTMDSSNYSNVLRLARTKSDQNKVRLILNESNPSQNKSVPDPYYGGNEGFETVFNLLDEACEVICKRIKEGTL